MTAIRMGLGGAGALLAGLLCTAIAAAAPEAGLKLLLVGGFGGVVVLAVILSGRPKEILLALYVVTLTYNRQYFSLDGIFGAQGSYGIYWVPADPLLLLLLGTALLERARGAPATWPPAAGGARPVMLFCAAASLSAVLAVHPEWAAADVVRIAKFALLLGWLQRAMTVSLWYALVAALAVSVVLQSALGVMQVALHADKSLLSLVGGQGDATIDAGVGELENRARGTLGHPNYLAPYLLWLLPASLGTALFSRDRRVFLLGIAVTLAGLAGLLATESRGPIALAALALPAVVAIAVWARVLRVTTALGSAILLAALGAAATLPFLGAIRARLTGDLAASLLFREQYDAAALAIWQGNRWFGVGLNNSGEELGHYAPTLRAIVAQLEQFGALAGVRAAAPVHNVYLLILAETGVVGLFGFLVLLGAILARGVVAARAAADGTRGLCIGLTVGLAAQYIQQLLDFSLWFDPSWYTLALIAVVLGSVPWLRPRIA